MGTQVISTHNTSDEIIATDQKICGFATINGIGEESFLVQKSNSSRVKVAWLPHRMDSNNNFENGVPEDRRGSCRPKLTK